jgi:threonine/homoserine/homoserine lactone efflux protein
VSALLSGFGLGFGVAAGFGPINVLCLTTGLRNGFAPAFGIGLGAAIVDGFYAFLAGLGVAAVITGDVRAWLQVVGGVALVVIGIRIARSTRSAAEASTTTTSFGSALRLSLAATLANPPTIVSWAAAFAGVVPALGLSRAETLTPSRSQAASSSRDSASSSPWTAREASSHSGLLCGAEKRREPT